MDIYAVITDRMIQEMEAGYDMVVFGFQVLPPAKKERKKANECRNYRKNA